MKPYFHWLWFCGICYALGTDMAHASTTTLTCSCGKIAVPPQTCAQVCGWTDPGGEIGNKFCMCNTTTYTLLSDGHTYKVVKPEYDVVEKCSDCKYTTSYACGVGYYLDQADGETCEPCPYSQKSADKNSGGITDCYAPADTLFAKDGNQFKYTQNCYYSKTANGNDFDEQSTTTTQ